ncbi:Fc.00g096710.m01.CDS01 [Cosmosporella sp. VM-42]
MSGRINQSKLVPPMTNCAADCFLVAELIPMKSRVIHKFYEPLVLLKALNAAIREPAIPSTADVKIDTRDQKQVFQAVVYKLGHICDSIKGNGGPTITSFMVLQDEHEVDKIHYWFASNRRSHAELEFTAEYVRTLLRLVHSASGDRLQHRSVVDALLDHVLAFNRPRVTHYLRKMSIEATKCLGYALDLPNEDGKAMLEELQKLLDRIDFDISPTRLDSTFIEDCKKAIYMLDRLQGSATGNELAERAREGRFLHGVPSKECWSELQHSISRTLAYLQSVKFILLAKDKWPELFRNFEVSFLESSVPMPRPYRNASQSADSIVGRLTRRQKDIDIFRNFVQELQVFNLDELIQREYKKESFQPIVHSEVLLLDYLDKTDQLEAASFFNGWKYIGSSKPTCKLCNHYFGAHKSGIEHRPTHGNLYLSWRVPDVLVSEGDSGDKARQVMVDRVLEKVRKDAFDIVRKKTPSIFKVNDSDTFSARLSTRRWDGSVVDDDMASMVGQMDLNERLEF